MNYKITSTILSLAIVSVILTGCGKQANNTNAPETMQPETPTVTNTTTLTNGSYQADTEQSSMKWSGKKILVESEHYGSIKIKSGSLTIIDNKLATGDFIIDMTTINSEDSEGNTKINLEKHLNSEDFFNTATYPEAKLAITAVNTNNASTGSYEVTANLTIKDITNPVTFTAQLNEANGQITAMSEFSIDRTLWNVKYGSGQFFTDLGDKVIDDQIKFTINLVVKQ